MLMSKQMQMNVHIYGYVCVRACVCVCVGVGVCIAYYCCQKQNVWIFLDGSIGLYSSNDVIRSTELLKLHVWDY